MPPPRTIDLAQDFIAGVHRHAAKCVFGEHHKVDRACAALGLANHGDHPGRLCRDMGAGCDRGQLQLHQADDDAIRRFVEPAQAVDVPPFLAR
jgi:hypothetical protein